MYLNGDVQAGVSKRVWTSADAAADDSRANVEYFKYEKKS